MHFDEGYGFQEEHFNWNFLLKTLQEIRTNHFQKIFSGPEHSSQIIPIQN